MKNTSFHKDNIICNIPDDYGLLNKYDFFSENFEINKYPEEYYKNILNKFEGTVLTFKIFMPLYEKNDEKYGNMKKPRILERYGKLYVLEMTQESLVEFKKNEFNKDIQTLNDLGIQFIGKVIVFINKSTYRKEVITVTDPENVEQWLLNNLG